MMKKLLRILLGIGVVTLVFGTPPAHAIFGIRAARTALAARKAKQLASSSDEAVPPVKKKTARPERPEDLEDVIP